MVTKKRLPYLRNLCIFKIYLLWQVQSCLGFLYLISFAFIHQMALVCGIQICKLHVTHEKKKWKNSFSFFGINFRWVNKIELIATK